MVKLTIPQPSTTERIELCRWANPNNEDYLQQLYDNYQKLLSEMRRRGVRVLTIDWREFGPPVEIWKKICSLVESEDQWYEQLTFGLTKEPRVPIIPNSGTD